MVYTYDQSEYLVAKSTPLLMLWMMMVTTKSLAADPASKDKMLMGTTPAGHIDESSQWLKMSRNHCSSSSSGGPKRETQTLQNIPPKRPTARVLHPQSTQSAGPVRFLIFCSISISLLASLEAVRRPLYTTGAY